LTISHIFYQNENNQTHFSTSTAVCSMSSTAPQGSKSKSAILTKHPLLSADGHHSSLCECGACVSMTTKVALDRQRARCINQLPRGMRTEVHAVHKYARRHRDREASLSLIANTERALCTYACRLPHLHSNGIYPACLYGAAAPVHCA
jgi:hypothetical protein